MKKKTHPHFLPSYFLLNDIKLVALFTNPVLLSPFAATVETGTGILFGENGPCDRDSLVVGLYVVAVIPDVFSGSPELLGTSTLASLLDDLTLVHLQPDFDLLVLSRPNFHLHGRFPG